MTNYQIMIGADDGPAERFRVSRECVAQYTLARSAERRVDA